jgi:hypothetical protein
MLSINASERTFTPECNDFLVGQRQEDGHLHIIVEQVSVNGWD